jgi:hypothetical protein
MRFLACFVAALSWGSVALAQDRYTLRLVVKSNRPCLITIDGRWQADCNDVCVFTWENYPEKVKRGTITATQSGDDQPLSRPYILVAGDRPGEIVLNFQPRLFRGTHDYPPVVNHPTQPLQVPTITEFAPAPPCQPAAPPKPAPLPVAPTVSYCWVNWETYFWIGAALLLLTLCVYSYWKWRVCRLWNRELAHHGKKLASSGHADIVQCKQ